MKRILITIGLLCLFLSHSNSSQEFKGLFPVMDGWNLIIEEKIYDVTNLWELINGAADVFFAYDFRFLNYCDYRNEGKQVRVEIYQHSNPDNAFGIYRAEKASDYATLELGVEGYLTDGAIGFNTGKYYIKVLDYGRIKATEEELLLIANTVHKNIGEKDVFPMEFRIMPEENKIQDSEGFILKNFLGYEVLKYAFIQDYKCETNNYKLFIIKTKSEEEATKIIKTYFSIIKFSFNEGMSYYLVSDPYNGAVYMGKIRNFLFGAVYFEKECDIISNLEQLRKGIESLEGNTAEFNYQGTGDIDISSGSTAISKKSNSK